MDLAVWILAGAALGWITYSYLAINEDRGLVASMIIGGAGGAIGGKLIAPMFTVAAAGQGELSIATVLFAGATAAAALAVGNLVQKRWGI